MKRLVYTTLLVGSFNVFSVFSQNVGISATGVAPDNSAGLDVNFNDKGVLIPRVTLTSQTDATTISSPAPSLLVYHTGSAGLPIAGYYYNAGNATSPNWVKLLITGNPSDAWLTLGNAGTNPTNHFIGTTDNVSLVFRTNNTERMRILNTGQVGIGNNSPWFTLDVATNTDWGGARVKGTLNTQLIVESPSSNSTQLAFFQNNTPMFVNYVAPNGLYWSVGRFNNSGTYLDAPLTILRSNGYVGIVTQNPQTQLHVDNLSGASTVVRISSSSASTFRGIQVGTTNGWYFGADNSENFVINRDAPLGTGISVFKIYSSANTRMSHFVSRSSGISGTGTNNDGPTNVIIEAGNGSGRQYDWPNGWGGGISTWDICGASTFMTGYSTRSDISYKRQIKELSFDKIIESFMNLKPVQYLINTETLKVDDPDRLRFGFIANDVEKLFPNLVINAGMPAEVKRGLEYDGFIPLIIAVVQNQQKVIQEQQKKIKELEEKIQKISK